MTKQANLPKWLDSQTVLAETAIEAKSTKNYNGGEVEYQLPKNEKVRGKPWKVRSTISIPT